MILEAGNLQQLTKQLVEQYLTDSGTSPGASEEAASDLYADFRVYLSNKGYSVEPSLRAFGRVLSKRLPFRKAATGTKYLISKPGGLV